MSDWCATDGLDDDVWVFSRALHPCYLETGACMWAGVALLVTACINTGRLLRARQCCQRGTREKGPMGMTGREAAFIGGSSFIAAIHALHAGAAVALHLPKYHVFTHFTLLAAWLLLAGLTLYCAKVHVVLDFRLMCCVMLVVYLWSLETYWSLYRLFDGFPVAYVRATIWSLMLQTVVTTLLAVMDFKTQKALAPAGYQRLPSGPCAAAPGAPGADVESGAATAATAAAATLKKPPPVAQPGGLARAGSEPPPDPDSQRSWVALFWDACAAVWPEARGLQVRASLAFALLLAMRVLNLAVPILYKKVVDSLALQETDASGASQGLWWGWLSPWVLLYLVALFFQGGAGGGVVGAINNIRQVLWIPVSQDAYRRICMRIFGHMLNLDLNLHLSRKTGEVTKQIDRGTNAMQNILSTIMFSIVPTCIDVLTASTYLAQALEPSIALTVFVTVGSYIPITIIITEWRGALRREMNQTDQIQAARVTDALLNYETVHYFNNLQHEQQMYAKAIANYQSAEYKAMASVNLLNSVQSAIMWLGISVGLLVCSNGVHKGELTVGDVVLFLSLMAQLYGPLNWFGAYYRTIQQYLIDMENLFQLLGKKSHVNEKPGAKDLIVPQGKVEYDSVCFEYERGTPVLRHVSFTVPGGQTVAFVGATGSGKSTLTRLIFRFYDVTGGAIRIDGQDIRDVTLDSLRSAVGMVPQDTVLFNDTILMNIRYGRLDATDDEVYEAAEAACIHEAITTRFPKGYKTIVGERGLRLSGGEKQRVAFARALLKNSPVLVLDEATSALDTLTERKIQGALAAKRASRTTLIVAHRLSTIVDADIIVVMHLGQLVEMGSHQELLAKAGLYAELWNKQLSSATAAAGEVSDGLEDTAAGQGGSSSSQPAAGSAPATEETLGS